MSSGPFLYPNVSSIPSGASTPAERNIKKQEGVKSEFDQVFDQKLEQIRDPLKFSAHATQRMMERKIQLDGPMMERVNQAIDKAAAKGIEDTLILTGDAALIVSVKNRTVVTAMDRAAMKDNVFSNIDGAIIL